MLSMVWFKTLNLNTILPYFTFFSPTAKSSHSKIWVIDKICIISLKYVLVYNIQVQEMQQYKHNYINDVKSITRHAFCWCINRLWRKDRCKTWSYRMPTWRCSQSSGQIHIYSLHSGNKMDFIRNLLRHKSQKPLASWTIITFDATYNEKNMRLLWKSTHLLSKLQPRHS